MTRSTIPPRLVRSVSAIWAVAKELFLEHAGSRLWRLVGTQVTNLVDGEWRLLSLLGGPRNG